MTGAACRTVVTGVGLCTPLGGTLDATWDRLLAGESAIAPLEHLRTGVTGCHAAALCAAASQPPPLRVPKRAKYAGRAVTCALHALGEAMRGAGLGPSWPDPYRIAVHGATGQTGLDVEEFFPALSAAWREDSTGDFARLGGPASRLVDPHFSLRTLSNAGLALIAAEAGAFGPSANYVQSESASAQAVQAAARDLEDGRADLAFVFACDSLPHPSTWLAFDGMGLLSRQPAARALSPFDRTRDGLVLGEGAAVLVLESSGHAARRGAPVIAELAGVRFARAMDAWETTSADGLRAALEPIVAAGARPAGGIERSQVGFLVARGLGTVAHDAREAAAIVAAGASDLWVTALKGATGYLGAATGLVEAAIAIRALSVGVVPPITHLETPDPTLGLRLVRRPVPLSDNATQAITLSAGWSAEWALMILSKPAAVS